MLPEQQAYLKRHLFIDVQTVAATPDYDSLTAGMRVLWDQKASAQSNSKQLSVPDLYRDRAALYAEFGKVISIGLGYFTVLEQETELRITSVSGGTEAEILTRFSGMLQQGRFSGRGSRQTLLCAHNGREFDFPYLCRRFLLNALPLPELLNPSGRKPWELPITDTMELWRFGEKRSFISLAGLALLFGVPGAEADLEKLNVTDAYYNNEHGKIRSHCLRQVSLTAQVLMHLQHLPPLSEEQIKYVD